MRRYCLTARQSIGKRILLEKQYIDVTELSEFLGSIKYPVYYLDYETAANAVPIVG